MRKINAIQILVFLLLLCAILLLGVTTTFFLFGSIPLGDFRGITLVVLAIFFIYLYAFMIYRFFLFVMPLNEGEIAENSQQEFVYHIYVLFYLILFFPIMRSGAIPMPIMRPIYLALGARLGQNTYGGGIIYDPKFVEVGENCLFGQNCLIVPHVIEGRRLAHYRIKIGNNVTIGAHAVVLSNVIIEDNAIIATGAVVKKGTHVRAGEVWGGVPAKRLQQA